MKADWVVELLSIKGVVNRQLALVSLWTIGPIRLSFYWTVLGIAEIPMCGMLVVLVRLLIIRCRACGEPSGMR